MKRWRDTTKRWHPNLPGALAPRRTQLPPTVYSNPRISWWQRAWFVACSSTVAAMAATVLLSLSLILYQSPSSASSFTFFLIGIGLFYVVYSTAGRTVRENLNFRGTLNHELLHLRAAALLGRRLRGVIASNVGGAAIYQSSTNRGSLLITLAPYFVYVEILLLLVVHLLTDYAIAERTIELLLGFMWAYWGLTIWKQARPHQPDLQEAGLVTSYLSIAAGVLFWLSCTLLILTEDPANILEMSLVMADGAVEWVLRQATEVRDLISDVASWILTYLTTLTERL